MKIVSSARASKAADLTGIGCFEDAKVLLEGAASLPAPVRETVRRTLDKKKFSGKAGESFFIPLTPKTGGSILLLGLGKKEKFTLEKVRRAASKLLSQAKLFRHESVRFDVDSFARGFSDAETAAAAVEGFRLADYHFGKYKSRPSPAASVAEVELVSPGRGKALARAVAEAEIVSEGVIFTRNLMNEPANVMTPARLARAAKEMAAKNGLLCKILGPAEIRRLKMGGVLGVAQGSVNPPQFIILENRAHRSARPVVLAGKGITFDSGGISIKPSGDMDKMKFDMGGAAAVIGAMKVIANLKLPVHVIGLAPAAENMPGSTAQRPGDILTCLNGKTVEVLNTDAEGRLILADALSYAKRYKPRALVDIATLTGSCGSFFGDIASGVMGTDPDLIRRLIAAGERTGERCWELPLWDEYFELIRATYADVQNTSRKASGAITAGMFLKEFADHTPSWAHLDIAGTAWADNPRPLSAIGATGVGVRLLVELVKSYL
ncbi:MAG TPA: leucyl aminopeptidase [Candidatus Eisenbacteria bacterium]|nr:leucyl aminopeptidase [Candidatus Eisenbacteria bacterium]